MNPIILCALIVQHFISAADRVAGAIVGFLITTCILVWGASVYSVGGAIAFFGAKLSSEVFYGLCTVWYAFDLKLLIQALRARKASSRDLAIDRGAKEPLLLPATPATNASDSPQRIGHANRGEFVLLPGAARSTPELPNSGATSRANSLTS